MRNFFLIIIISFIICTGFLFDDMRDNYTGTYMCQRVCFRKNGLTRNIDSIIDTLSIEISKDSLDSLLQININNTVYKVKLIDKNLRSITPHTFYGGKFFSIDSLTFTVENSRAASCNLSGKKIE